MKNFLLASLQSSKRTKLLFRYFLLLVCANALLWATYSFLVCHDCDTLIDLGYSIYNRLQASKEGKVDYTKLLSLLQDTSGKGYDIYEPSFLDLSESTLNFSADFEKCWPSELIARSRRLVVLNEQTVGYGNRLYAFINAFTLALLTESKLILNWKHIDKYIDILEQLESKGEKTFSLNSKFKVYGASPRKIVFDTHTANAWQKHKNMSQIAASSSVPSSFLEFSNTSLAMLEVKNYNALFFELLAGSSLKMAQFRDKLAACGLLDRRIADEANKLRNRFDVNVMFSAGFSLAHSILNRVWVPTENGVRQLVTKYMEDNDFENSYVIGLHMRFDYMSYSSDVTNMILCAINVEKRFMLAKGIENKKRRVKWFIATDSDRNLRRIKKSFNVQIGGKVISTFGRISHIDKHGGGYKRTVLDSEVLSRCDELIITGGSTFGM
jgi:hypothetical protein